MLSLQIFSSHGYNPRAHSCSPPSQYGLEWTTPAVEISPYPHRAAFPPGGRRRYERAVSPAVRNRRTISSAADPGRPRRRGCYLALLGGSAAVLDANARCRCRHCCRRQSLLPGAGPALPRAAGRMKQAGGDDRSPVVPPSESETAMMRTSLGQQGAAAAALFLLVTLATAAAQQTQG